MMGMNFWLTISIRWSLTIGWVVIIWLNAHWSVALAITAWFIRIEFEAIHEEMKKKRGLT